MTFRDCALAEASRYGSDPWVFLRELLQNARDAGARRVEITVARGDGVELIRFRDDGCGMSAEHAQRYLFALYASSKEEDEGQVGQFGVGFWSVLRFRPRRIVIRSRPLAGRGDAGRHGTAWQVELDRRLESAAFSACELEAGTEIVLERPLEEEGPDGRDLATAVFAAVHRYGRYATRYEKARWTALKSRGEQPLEITVDGRRVDTEMRLPAPSSVFRRRGLRGAVALAEAPSVELFANGLFVRQAASLEDLLEESPSTGDGASMLDLPATVAPWIVLDSRELEVLLARSDVRQTRHLRRLVKTAERELERLIERQLEAVRPRSRIASWRARLLASGRRLGAGLRRAPTWKKLAWLVVPAGLAGAALGWTALSRPAANAPAVGWIARPAFGPVVAHYADLGARYQGARLDPAESRGTQLALTYSPASQVLFLNALVVDDPNGSPADAAGEPVAVGRYPGAPCQNPVACVSFSLVTASGPMRLPVPTGHRVDPSSVRLNGRPAAIARTAADEPLLAAREGDLVEYRTGPAPVPPEILSTVPAPPLPPALAAVGHRLRQQPIESRVEGAVAEVAARVAYDRTELAAQAYAAERARGRDFVEAALAVGKGDCDVQNGLVVALLQTAGVAARLAVGYVGRNGRAEPGLHAWAEFLASDGSWRVADASTRSPVADTASLRGENAVSVTALPAAPSPGAVLPGSLALLVASVLGLGGWWWRRASPPAAVELAETDLAELLAGAFRHPALGRMPALVHGRYVPLIAAAAVSLHQARRRAAAGKLFSSAAGGPLARAAAARGRWVIDAAVPEGRVACLGLGANDLDAWERLLERSERPALVRHVNDCLESVGESWRIAVVTPLDAAVEVVDLGLLGLGLRQVLIDPQRAGVALAGPWLELCSEVAAFRLLDAAAAHLDLPPAERARLLAEPARRALLERHGS